MNKLFKPDILECLRYCLNKGFLIVVLLHLSVFQITAQVPGCMELNWQILTKDAEYAKIIEEGTVVDRKIFLVDFLSSDLAQQYSKCPIDTTKFFQTIQAPQLIWAADLANLYENLGMLDSALYFFNVGLGNAQKHPYKGQLIEYYTLITNKALLLESRGEIEEAENTLNESINEIKKHRPEGNAVYGVLLNQLSQIYQTNGKLDSALTTGKLAVETIGNGIKSNSDRVSYAISLGILGATYIEMGDLDRALSCLEESRDSLQSLSTVSGLFTKSPEIDIRNKLGHTYLQKGEYEKALQVYAGLRTLVGQYDGIPSQRYFVQTNNLINIYSPLGNFERSLHLINQSEELLAEMPELKKNERYWEFLYVKARYLHKQGKALKDLKMLREALQIFREIYTHDLELFGDENSDIYSDLLSIGASLETIGALEKDKDFIFEAIECYDKVVKQEKFQVLCFRAHSNLATILDGRLRKDKEARYHYLEALNRARTLFDERSNFFGEVAFNYGIFLYRKGKRDSSFHYLNKAIDNLGKRTRLYYPVLSEKGRLDLLRDNKTLLDPCLSRASEVDGLDITGIYDNYLAMKGLGLEANFDLKNSILLEDSDSLFKSQYYDWRAVCTKISQGLSLSLEERTEIGIDLDSLKLIAEDLENKLQIKSSTFRGQAIRNKTFITFTGLKSKLDDETVAVDFVEFQYHNGLNWTDTTYYYAFVTAHDLDRPAFIKLCTKAMLEEKLSVTVGENTDSYVRVRKQANALYELVWQPLEVIIGEKKRIYLSPGGVIHRLAISALASTKEGESLLVDKYEFSQYGSFRELLIEKEEKKSLVSVPSRKAIALFGGAQHDLDSLAISKLLKSTQDKGYSSKPKFSVVDILQTMNGNQTRIFKEYKDLPSSKTTMETIGKDFAKKGWDVYQYLGLDAIEDRLPDLNAIKPNIVHFDLHGFFYKSSSERMMEDLGTFGRIATNPNPMFRSGLVFTGANHVLAGGKPIGNMDDGLLTAYEVANLELNNTQLAVLAACDTGLGEIFNGEGVFGLQRAFKAAGVDKLILSLWKVPDEHTSEFMRYFYNFYLQGDSIMKAFQTAQLEMRAKYEPYYWAAFVLLN